MANVPVRRALAADMATPSGAAAIEAVCGPRAGADWDGARGAARYSRRGMACTPASPCPSIPTSSRFC